MTVSECMKQGKCNRCRFGVREMGYAYDCYCAYDEDPCPSENIITWHPYPKETPTEPNYYLVTVKGKHIELDAWSGEHWSYIASVDVIAWAELPKAYEEG